jgi:hypothetical protein
VSYEHGGWATPISVYTPDTHKVVPKDAVVLDISHEDLNVLVDHLDSHFLNGPITRSFIRQVREQTKPPRIPEPSLFKVVVAGPPHDRTTWVRGKKGWTNLDAVGPYLNWSRWVDLIDPALVRDGIES